MKVNFDKIKFSFRAKDNSYDICFPGLKLEDCKAAIIFDGEVHLPEWKVLRDEKEMVVLSAEDESGKWLLQFKPATNCSGISGIEIQLTGEIKRNYRKISLAPLRIKTLSADQFLVHPRGMGGCESVLLPLKDEKEFETAFQQMIRIGDKILQIAHPLEQFHLSTITGIINGNEIQDFSVRSDIEFPEPGKVEAEPVELYFSDDGHQLMLDWAEKYRSQDKIFSAVKAGWNSWDYYRWTITEEEVLKNAEFIAADPVLSKHIKKVIVDDGWQYCYGEWEANSLFPHGMKWLAEQLTGMGFEPGLWFAPTIIEPHARIGQLDIDMLAKGEADHPCLCYECMSRYGMVLDPTHPKVQKWLFELFTQYTEMGYKYFKLDFLWHVLKARRFFDNSIPRGRILSRIMEPIREATKGKAEILGCNYRFEGGPDYVDFVRVSGDVHADWNCARRVALAVASRFWADRRLWINDPDFVVCRGPETSNDPDLDRLKYYPVWLTPEMTEVDHKVQKLNTLSFEEAKVLAGIAIISGGAVNLSDKLTVLNEKGLELVRKCVSAEKGSTGVPLDLFTSIYPKYWKQKLNNGWRIFLVNWEDEEVELSMDLNKLNIETETAKDFWTGETVPINNNRIEKIFKPHSCLMLEI